MSKVMVAREKWGWGWEVVVGWIGEVCFEEIGGIGMVGRFEGVGIFIEVTGWRDIGVGMDMLHISAGLIKMALSRQCWYFAMLFMMCI